MFYSDELPNFVGPTNSVIVSVPDTVKEGDFYHNETFVPFAEWRSLYTDDELLNILRMERNSKITRLDWLVLRHQEQIALSVTPTLSAQEYQDLLAYKQSLRDFPETANVRNPVWPTPPAFLNPSN